jgi:hypothetical protein
MPRGYRGLTREETALNTFGSLSHTSVVSLPRRRHTLPRTTLAPSAQRHTRPVQAIGRGVFVCKPPMGLPLPVSPASSTERVISAKAILDVATHVTAGGRAAHTRISPTSLFDAPRHLQRPESDSRDANSRTKLRSPHRRPALIEAIPRMRAPDAPLHTSPSSRRTPRGVIHPAEPQCRRWHEPMHVSPDNLASLFKSDRDRH